MRLVSVAKIYITSIRHLFSVSFMSPYITMTSILLTYTYTHTHTHTAYRLFCLTDLFID